jgi:hypothetical protein
MAGIAARQAEQAAHFCTKFRRLMVFRALNVYEFIVMELWGFWKAVLICNNNLRNPEHLEVNN